MDYCLGFEPGDAMNEKGDPFTQTILLGTEAKPGAALTKNPPVLAPGSPQVWKRAVFTVMGLQSFGLTD